MNNNNISAFTFPPNTTPQKAHLSLLYVVLSCDLILCK